MDEVKKFVADNQHQLGYVMQEASRQWVENNPAGALTVGTCKYFIDKHGDYHSLLDRIEHLESQLKIYQKNR
jgi:hypothetical protein